MSHIDKLFGRWEPTCAYYGSNGLKDEALIKIIERPDDIPPLVHMYSDLAGMGLEHKGQEQHAIPYQLLYYMQRLWELTYDNKWPYQFYKLIEVGKDYTGVYDKWMTKVKGVVAVNPTKSRELLIEELLA